MNSMNTSSVELISESSKLVGRVAARKYSSVLGNVSTPEAMSESSKVVGVVVVKKESSGLGNIPPKFSK